VPEKIGAINIPRNIPRKIPRDIPPQYSPATNHRKKSALIFQIFLKQNSSNKITLIKRDISQ